MSSWYMADIKDADIVVSTRIRLARNIRGIPFPQRMNSAQKQELKSKVKSAIEEIMKDLIKNTKFSKRDTLCQISGMKDSIKGKMYGSDSKITIEINEDIIKKLYQGKVLELLTIFHELNHLLIYKLLFF